VAVVVFHFNPVAMLVLLLLEATEHRLRQAASTLVGVKAELKLLVAMVDCVDQVVLGFLAQQVHLDKVVLLLLQVAAVAAVVTTVAAVAPWNAMPDQVVAVQAGSILHW
jgi:hypothetical protein